MDVKKSKNFLLIGMVVFLTVGVVALAGVCYVLYTNSQQDAADSQDVNVQATYSPSGTSITVSEDKRDVVNEIKDKVAKGMIEVKMTNGWVFQEGGKKSNAYLANSERNELDLRFEITLADTGEVILVSPDVPVGSCIENFPLSVILEPGEYDIVVAHQQILDGEVYNTVRTSSVITVQ